MSLINIFQTILTALQTLATNIWTAIFDGVNFSVLWSWLPSDIGSAANALIILLFLFAVIHFIRSILPF